MTERERLIEVITEAIDDKKGSRIVSLDLSGFDGAVTDAFVICDASSTAQVAAITANVEEKVFEKCGQKVWRTEGLQNSLWVVMDYGEVLVHIFLRELRDFYKLEQLWSDAPSKSYFSENV